MSHETGPTSGAVADDAPLYVVLGTHKTAMSFASARKVDARRIVSEAHGTDHLQGEKSRVILVTTRDTPSSWSNRDSVRMHVDIVNHSNGFPTDEISYR